MLTRWVYSDPHRDFDTLRRQFDRLFNDFDWARAGYSRRASRKYWPRMNLLDNGDAFVIHAEVPGLSNDDIKIEATQESVSLSGRRKSDSPENYAVHRSEREAISFARSFALPAKVDVERVSAHLKNGLLTVVLPRRLEDKPRSIAVKVG